MMVCLRHSLIIEVHTKLIKDSHILMLAVFVLSWMNQCFHLHGHWGEQKQFHLPHITGWVNCYWACFYVCMSVSLSPVCDGVWTPLNLFIGNRLFHFLPWLSKSMALECGSPFLTEQSVSRPKFIKTPKLIKNTISVL